MIKCFLSHSSKDKESYIEFVRKELPAEKVFYDKLNFKPGESNWNEITRGIDESSIFIFFISSHSLDSDWVKRELEYAKKNHDEGKLKLIYPILIDSAITHKDKRIPEWIKYEFNIQPITQPKKAARLIRAKLMELSWEIYPNIYKKKQLFIGRNTQVQKVEERFDAYELCPPKVFIVSGIPSIGRKSFINYSLKKSNIIQQSYELLQIYLDVNDSIEDFILKLDDLGVTEPISKENFLNMSMNEKINIALKIIKDISHSQEKVLIEDKGVIVQFDGNIADWFLSIVNNISKSDDYANFLFCIASKYRLDKRKILKEYAEYFYTEEIPELDKKERKGLLARYAKLLELQLSSEDLNFFSDLLTGYPEQAIYTIDVIDRTNVFEAKKISHEIKNYASDRAEILILDAIRDLNQKIIFSEEEIRDFLYFLSRFEFVSYDFLFSLIKEEDYYPLLKIFLAYSLCEKLGDGGLYIRVNDIIRDYISRRQFNISSKFSEIVKIHIDHFLNKDIDGDHDLSDYNFSIQEALKEGKEIPEKLLIPSYFLKTIKSIYEKTGNHNYREVIKLCNRVLENKENIDPYILKQIYFLECQSLARLSNKDFFNVVKEVEGPDSDFLYGFYYRIEGKQDLAIGCFNKFLQYKPNSFRAKSELVIIYMQRDEYDKAYELAEEIYMHKPNNPININHYLSCIFYKKRHNQFDNLPMVNNLLSKLEMDPSERAKEMSMTARAKYLAFFENKFNTACELLDSTIDQFPNVVYPILTLADLSISFKNRDMLKKSISLLDNRESRIKNTQTYRSYIRYKCIYLVVDEKKQEAKKLAYDKLKGMEKESLDKFINQLNKIDIKNWD